MHKETSPRRVFLSIILLFCALVATYPFIYMVLLSLTDSATVYVRLEDGISLVNYRRIQQNFSYLLHLMNSSIVAIASCFLNGLLGSMAAFGFAKKKFPGKNFLFSLILSLALH
ncbi:MAG TPA: hypothetical protein DDW87_12395 [Firmicutes bacterium]|nr:hypothetical protein [Bacillota bacterium]